MIHTPCVPKKNEMRTLALMVFLIAGLQAILHVHQVSESGDAYEWVLYALPYWGFLMLSGLIGWAIWTDLYPQTPINLLRDHDFPTHFYVILSFTFLGLSSLYRIGISRYAGTRKVHHGKASLLTIAIKPIASIISFIGSVLGIVSFYLQFLRK
jgi:hypothetical protein